MERKERKKELKSVVLLNGEKFEREMKYACGCTTIILNRLACMRKY